MSTRKDMGAPDGAPSDDAASAGAPGGEPTYLDRLHEDGPYLSRLLLLYDGPMPPTVNTVTDRVRMKFGLSSVSEIGGAPDGSESVDDRNESGTGAESPTNWSRAMHIEDYPFPVVVSAGGAPNAEVVANSVSLRERGWWEPERLQRLATAQSTLELATILEPSNAQTAYGFFLKIAALAGGGDCIAWIDLESGQAIRPQELYDTTSSAAPPAMSDVFRLVASRGSVGDDNEASSMPAEEVADDAGNSGELVSLSSRGLLRAMLPEIQFPPLTSADLPTAHEFVTAVAGQWVMLGPGEPGEERGLLGTPLGFAWWPLEAAPGIPSPAPDRGKWVLIVPAGTSADEVANATPTDAAQWGRDLVGQFAAYGLQSVTPFESRIRETQSRERAGFVARLWSALEDRADASFMLKIGFVPDEEAGGGAPTSAGASTSATDAPIDALEAVRRELVESGELEEDAPADFASMVEDATIGDDFEEVEMPKKPSAAEEWRRHVAAVHLWFRLRDVANDAYEAELVSEPLGRDDLRQGDVGWYRRDQLSDWQVMVDGHRLGPTDLLAIRAVLTEMESGA